ncbi:MAG: histidine triad nucleotide-binding protein [Deltaproteobacteria bacterium]|nr:histidine triad nucleotide-binding protein [Deltaproteobacteria bacterium]
MGDTSCIFCKIARGELGTPFVYQDADVVAFRDLHPQAPTHVLVIPRRHVDSLAASTAADDVLLGKVLAGVRATADQLGLVQSGYRTVLNTGAGAGQSVLHLHAHLLAGRTLAWPPG